MTKLSEQVRMLEKKAKAFEGAANRAFIVLEETPKPVWDDEREINDRIQEAHDILDIVLTEYLDPRIGAEFYEEEGKG